MENYERNRILRNFILKVILVIVIALLLVWAIPKIITGVKTRKEKSINTKKEVEVFKTNLKNMEEAGKEYFTYENLPHIVGDKKVITLRKMYELNLISELTTNTGKRCDSDKSYIEVTNKENEYSMKTNLYCDHKEDSTLTSISKEDKSTDKAIESKTTPQSSGTSNSNSYVPTQQQTTTTYKEVTVTKVIPGYKIEKKNSYEYMKVVVEKVPNYSSWSNWVPYTDNITPITCGATDTNCLKEIKVKEEETCTNNKCTKTKYYSTRTRTFINKETKLYEWSYWNDTKLLDAGYHYTGNWKKPNS